MLLVDTRRLTGPNLLGRSPLVIVEVDFAPGDSLDVALDLYRRELGRMRLALGLGPEVSPVVRAHVDGAVFAYEAPIDVMLACAEMSEWALTSAALALAGQPTLELEPKRTEIQEMWARDRNPRLLALQGEAARRGVPVQWDDDDVTVGQGRRSVSYPVGQIPETGGIPWETLGAIPIALITGTNGKTTSSRLLSHLAREAGLAVGSTSTDEVVVGDQIIEEGDWTGPSAARLVLRRPDVDLAVLETARGGILRRGLAVDHCDVALITNVGADHLGSFGVPDVHAMTSVKGVIADAVPASGTVVLNARDANLVSFAEHLASNVVFFADLDADDASAARAVTEAHVARGRSAVLARGGEIVCLDGATESVLCRIDEVPITLSGAARFNVENTLGVVAAARGLGINDAVIARGLKSFSVGQNPGRAQLFEKAGVRLLIDFGHNGEGVRAVFGLVAALREGRAGKLLVVTGSAGDRGAQEIEEIIAAVADQAPDRVWVRELHAYLRGRVPGELPEIFRLGLLARGVLAEAFTIAASEVDALEQAFAGAQPGDFIVLLVHVEHAAVGAFLGERGFSRSAG